MFKVFLQKDIEDTIAILTDMQMELLQHKEAMNDEMMKLLTSHIMEAVAKIGGEPGKGQFAQTVLAHYLRDGGFV